MLQDDTHWQVEAKSDRLDVCPGGEFFVLFGPPRRENRPSGRTPVNQHLVFSLDHSLSMASRAYPQSGRKWELKAPSKYKALQQAVKQALHNLPNQARLTVVCFSGEAEITFDKTVGEAKKERTMWSGLERDGTNMEAGLRLAASRLVASDAAIRRIVLFSDGMPNQGNLVDAPGLSGLSRSFLPRGVYVDAVGFGADADDLLLADVAGFCGHTSHVRNTEQDVQGMGQVFKALTDWAVHGYALGGHLELAVHPEFRVIGVYKVFPEQRIMPIPSDPAQGFRIQVGAVATGERRPQFVLHLKAPSVESHTPVSFLQVTGSLDLGGHSVTLNGSQAEALAVRMTRGSYQYNPHLENLVKGLRLQTNVDEQVRLYGAQPRSLLEIYQSAAHQARYQGIGDLARSYAEALRDLQTGVDGPDARNAERCRSRKTTSSPARAMGNGSGQRQTGTWTTRRR